MKFCARAGIRQVAQNNPPKFYVIGNNGDSAWLSVDKLCENGYNNKYEKELTSFV